MRPKSSQTFVNKSMLPCISDCVVAFSAQSSAKRKSRAVSLYTLVLACLHSAKLAIIISYPTSTSGIITYCFIKNNQELLLDLADFAVQEQPADNLMVAISRPWYNGSYTDHGP